MEQIATLRAQWFAELEQAIEAAQRLAWQLGSQQSTSDEARQLYGSLEEAKVRLDSLRGMGRGEMPAIEPDWLEKLGWKSPASELDEPF